MNKEVLNRNAKFLCGNVKNNNYGKYFKGHFFQNRIRYLIQIYLPENN